METRIELKKTKVVFEKTEYEIVLTDDGEELRAETFLDGTRIGPYFGVRHDVLFALGMDRGSAGGFLTALVRDDIRNKRWPQVLQAFRELQEEKEGLPG